MKAYDDQRALVEQLANRVEHWLREAIDARGTAHWVLAGGSTPTALYGELATRSLPWQQMHVYFGDERCVPPDHPDSNFRAAHEALLSLVQIPDAQVHRIQGEDREAAVAPYGAQLPARFDVVLLGMGADGHTASLFPGSAALEAGARVLYVDDSPKPPPERITLGLVALSSARHVAFMVSGAAKAEALAEVLSGESQLPAARVQPLDGTLDFFFDRAAASALRE